MTATLAQKRTRALRGLAMLLGVGGLLVATHRGEFWPFSIYPMFSQAGRSWQRSLVREHVPELERWQSRPLTQLPGIPFPLAPRGIPQIDFSEYVDHTAQWDAQRIAGLRALFGSALHGHGLTLYKVRPGDQGIAGAWATPILYLTEHTSAVP